MDEDCVKLSRPYLLYFPRNKPSKSVIGAYTKWPEHIKERICISIFFVAVFFLFKKISYSNTPCAVTVSITKAKLGISYSGRKKFSNFRNRKKFPKLQK